MAPLPSTIENIAENLKSTLEAIQVGDDYNYSPQKVTRESVDYASLNTFPVYEVIVAPESFQYFGKRVVNSINFYIRCYHYSEKGFYAPTIQSKMVQDIKAAILVDISRGGYASNTELIGVESDEGLVAPSIICQITVKIQYLSLDLNR